MDWVESQSIRALRSRVCKAREPLEGLESSGDVVGTEEVVRVRFELVMCVVEVALHRSVFDGADHALELPVGRAMVGLGQPVLDSTKDTEPVERMAAEASG
jgi:hypothetical protein